MYDMKNVINNLKIVSKSKSNIELAKKMDVGYDTLKAWLKRNTIGSSFDIVYNFCKKNDYSLDQIFDLTSEKMNENLLEKKLDLFSIRTLIAFYILIKNVEELYICKDLTDFNYSIKKHFKFATFDLAEDKFALFFDRDNLLNNISLHLNNQDIIFITKNKETILSILDRLIEKKENPIAKLFDFRRITRKIF